MQLRYIHFHSFEVATQSGVVMSRLFRGLGEFAIIEGPQSPFPEGMAYADAPETCLRDDAVECC